MPGPPEPIDIEADSIVLVWDPPRHDGGSKITGYELQVRKWRDEVYSPGDQINMKMERGELEGLEVKMNYAARVRAINAAGPGPWSIDSEQLTPKHSSLKPKIKINDGTA